MVNGPLIVPTPTPAAWAINGAQAGDGGRQRSNHVGGQMRGEGMRLGQAVMNAPPSGKFSPQMLGCTEAPAWVGYAAAIGVLC